MKLTETKQQKHVFMASSGSVTADILGQICSADG